MSTIKENLNKLADKDSPGTKGLGASVTRNPLTGGKGTTTGTATPPVTTSGVSGPLTIMEATGKELAIKDKDGEVLATFVEWSSYEVRDGGGNDFTLNPNIDGRVEIVDPYIP